MQATPEVLVLVHPIHLIKDSARRAVSRQLHRSRSTQRSQDVMTGVTAQPPSRCVIVWQCDYVLLHGGLGWTEQQLSRKCSRGLNGSCSELWVSRRLAEALLCLAWHAAGRLAL